MANKLVGNVVMVNSATANKFLTDDLATPAWTKLRIQSVFLSMANTAAVATFSLADTSTEIIRLDRNWAALDFPHGLDVDGLKVPTLSNGTAWLYLA